MIETQFFDWLDTSQSVSPRLTSFLYLNSNANTYRWVRLPPGVKYKIRINALSFCIKRINRYTRFLAILMLVNIKIFVCLMSWLNPRSSHTKDSKKMVLDATLLNTRHYKVRVKWSNQGNGVAPSLTPRGGSYWKGSLQVTLD